MMPNDMPVEQDLLDRLPDAIGTIRAGVATLARELEVLRERGPTPMPGPSKVRENRVSEMTYARLAPVLLRRVLRDAPNGVSSMQLQGALRVHPGTAIAVARRLAAEEGIVDVRRPVGRNGGSLYVYLAEGKRQEAMAALKRFVAALKVAAASLGPESEDSDVVAVEQVDEPK
jgi:hypothetical protein